MIRALRMLRAVVLAHRPELADTIAALDHEIEATLADAVKAGTDAHTVNTLRAAAAADPPEPT